MDPAGRGRTVGGQGIAQAASLIRGQGRGHKIAVTPTLVGRHLGVWEVVQTPDALFKT